jgi:hypothetical protein
MNDAALQVCTSTFIAVSGDMINLRKKPDFFEKSGFIFP